jgi:UDP-N-acetyl-D-mannosaminuronic acid dehydrogenase
MGISVVGLGKAGLPLASVIADADIEVYGIDLDKSKIDKLERKINPIPEEPGVQEILNKKIGKNFHVTSDYKSGMEKCSTHIVIVPLFIDSEHKADFSIIDSAFSSVGKNLKKGDLVVLETTVPVGTTENRITNILEANSKFKAGKDFFLAYSPERIMTGYSISRYKEFPKIVGGIDEASTRKAFEVYSKFCNKVYPVSNSRTAEMVKLSEGIYRDINIAIANELLKVSDKYDIDFWEMRLRANHQYCNIHEPGNVGGHCIPVYPWFVINEMEAPLMKTARELNDKMIEFYLQKIKKMCKTGKVGVIGLSYRNGVKEKAYTRSIPFIDLLKRNGYHVFGIDPMYNDVELKSEFGVSAIKDFSKMDVIVIFNNVTEYNEKLKSMKSKIIDIKNSMGKK